MKYGIHNRGLTLVELLVSISVLTILIALSFFALKGYTSTATNAVRIDGMGKLGNVIENERNKGINILAFTEGGNEIVDAHVGGTGVLVGVNYKSGDILPSSLRIDGQDFQDPSSGDIYKIGVTTKNKGKYQLSSTLQGEQGDIAKVIGVYKARDQEAILGEGKLGTNVFKLEYFEDAQEFYIGDTITGSGIAAGTTIKAISADGMRLILSNSLTGTITQVYLGSDEIEGLILGEGSSNDPVIDGSNIVPY